MNRRQNEKGKGGKKRVLEENITEDEKDRRQKKRLKEGRQRLREENNRG